VSRAALGGSWWCVPGTTQGPFDYAWHFVRVATPPASPAYVTGALNTAYAHFGAATFDCRLDSASLFVLCAFRHKAARVQKAADYSAVIRSGLVATPLASQGMTPQNSPNTVETHG
jgi:hypothetical protein